MVKHADAFLDKNATVLKKLVKKVSSGEAIESVVTEPVPQPAQKVSDADRNVEAIEHADGDLIDDGLMSVEDRRKANKQIEKNFKADSGGRRKKAAKIAKLLSVF
ncbi:hypothetical protein OESDEN_10796 [Oesophagostomum dentatum]|uniref:Uncharacterized protein n=1 Tax=Oesophagostomum dentatum TaxID=61180 RepID=A0A0B1T1T8_OESDE|nr:hypothetical protein OESDEN_10796 [Oesophagostomum dentatum]